MQEQIKIARQASYSFYKRNPHLEHDEIMAESNLAMMEAIETFDPTKGRSLNSWIGFIVHRHLNKTYKDYQHMEELFDWNMPNISQNPERVYIFKEVTNSLSTASKETIKMIFNDGIYAKKELKEKLRNKGFAWNKIQTAFYELRQIANAM